MTGAEFLRRLQRLGKQRSVTVRFVAERGKGSHGTVYFGQRFAVLKDRTKEVSPGLLAAILQQLGLGRADLR